MRILFLDLGSHSGSVACVTAEWVVASQEIDHRIGDHELVPLVAQTLRSAGWKLRDLTHTACVIGPGGFMSLRVAVAYINALSCSLGIPSAGMHLSDLYRTRCKMKDVLWVHSTKKQELFVRGFGRYAREWKKPAHHTLTGFLRRVGSMGSIRWIGELLLEHEDALRIHAKKCRKVPLRDMSVCLSVALSSLQYKHQILKPWYGRGW